jgi:hypothetical protein
MAALYAYPLALSSKFQGILVEIFGGEDHLNYALNPLIVRR